MQKRDWLLPSVVLTVIAIGAVLVLAPNPSGLLPALMVLPPWMAAAGLIAAISGFARAALVRNPAPGASFQRFCMTQQRYIAATALIMLFAGINMVSFMWTKTLLNYLVPFRADPWLAKADYALFGGYEPWAVLQRMNFAGAGVVYHPVWFILLIVALLATAAAPASPRRSAMLLTYFGLWTIIGPLIHCLLPAGGPIFFERLGHGARFAGLAGSPEVKHVADYLWDIYAENRFGAASGISAMPSMHVAMSTWTVIAVQQFARRSLPAALIGWVVIFGLSIALGWHYASDGIVGTLAALGTYAVLLRLMGRHAAAPAPIPAATPPPALHPQPV